MQCVIHTLPVLGDNYSYLVSYAGHAAAIDAADTKSILQVISHEGLVLEYILTTHNHYDHVHSNCELKKRTGCTVIGSEQRIPCVDAIPTEGFEIKLGALSIFVVATPGHTKTDLTYYIPASSLHKSGAVFTGDCLFNGGCGRLFAGDYAQMFASLKKIAALPDETLVYGGHNYMGENYAFALSVEPLNSVLKKSLAAIRLKDQRNMPTVPTSMHHEKMTNPFLRTHEPAIRATLGMPHASDLDVFKALRIQKDAF